MEPIEQKILKKLEHLKTQGQWRKLEVAPEELNVSHNDYLGLSAHPWILQTAKTELQRGGSQGSRLLGGHREIFEKAESEIAEFFGVPSALFFGTGYLANLAAVTALAPVCEHVYCDEKIHASLIDGVKLSDVPKTIVPHNKWGTVTEPKEGALFIAEALYSMDGDTVDFEPLKALVKKAKGILILDEAHSAGIMNESGQGLHLGAMKDIPMVGTVTFGKAFGVAGAALLAPGWVRELVIQTARSFIYSTAPSPWVVALVRASLKVMRAEGSKLREELWGRSLNFRKILENRIFSQPIKNTWDFRSPIIPVLTPGNDTALRISQIMRNSGWYLKPIRYPTVPKGTERLRISLNLCLGAEETYRLANILSETLKQEGL